MYLYLISLRSLSISRRFRFLKTPDYKRRRLYGNCENEYIVTAEDFSSVYIIGNVFQKLRLKGQKQETKFVPLHFANLKWMFSYDVPSHFLQKCPSPEATWQSLVAHSEATHSNQQCVNEVQSAVRMFIQTSLSLPFTQPFHMLTASVTGTYLWNCSVISLSK